MTRMMTTCLSQTNHTEGRLKLALTILKLVALFSSKQAPTCQLSLGRSTSVSFSVVR